MTRVRRYGKEADEFRADEEALLAIPKPKFVPRGERANTKGLALPKEHPDRDAAYLAFVRGELCAVWGEDGIHCAGVTEAAHLIGGMGEKRSDYYCVPLCTVHHRQQHDVGLIQFQVQHGVNLWQVSAELLIRWMRRSR
ncbi:MAG TPA: hypothetical protein VNL91_03900 [Thermoanaerobaculia bacterium]|nr:hypothetical protein [Thermoanaerobaculia bacterium]